MEMRDAVLATSAQLVRLLLRIDKLPRSARYKDNGTIVSAEDAKWTVDDLDPPSPLLERMRHKSLAAATTRLLELLARLLAAYSSDDQIDPRWVCRVLLALTDEFAERYSPAVTRMAALAGQLSPPAQCLGQAASQHSRTKTARENYWPPPHRVRL